MRVPSGTFMASDLRLPKGWYRFSGDAGTGIANKCPAENHCGTAHPGWMEGTHPTGAEGIVTRTACFRVGMNCCKDSYQIRVSNCGAFYVYELVEVPLIKRRYCGNGEGKGTHICILLIFY